MTLRVLTDNDKESGLKIYVANDGVLYQDQVIQMFNQAQKDRITFSLLILIPLRLGVDQLNPIYYSALKVSFKINI